MKKDAEVLLSMRERNKGTTQAVAAARAGMSVKTAHKYERAGKLPSQLKRPHSWRSRPNPFEADWPWVVEQLERDPALQATTLFALLCATQPGKYHHPTADAPAPHCLLAGAAWARARGDLRASAHA